jgi:Fic family protein
VTNTHDPAPAQQNRQSKTAKREKFRPLSEPQKARQEALNTLRQYDRMVELINAMLQTQQRFRLRPSAIQELNRISIKNIEAEAGRWRDAPIEIEGSRHQPPPAEDVPKHIDDLCEYVNEHWDDRSPFHLAAYVMWRLNWIHPFVDGNGRTTRAVSYYVLCAKLQFHMPGVTTVPEMIAQNKNPYYKALEASDAAAQAGSLDVSEMEYLLSDLLARQMVLALQRAQAPNLDQIDRARKEIASVQRDGHNRKRSTVEKLASSSALNLGARLGALTLLFFMMLILISTFGHPVPKDARFLVVIVLALAGGFSAGVIGGNASARGVIPLPTVKEHPLTIALTGGIAVLIILLILGSRLFT